MCVFASEYAIMFMRPARTASSSVNVIFNSEFVGATFFLGYSRFSSITILISCITFTTVEAILVRFISLFLLIHMILLLLLLLRCVIIRTKRTCQNQVM